MWPERASVPWMARTVAIACAASRRRLRSSHLLELARSWRSVTATEALLAFADKLFSSRAADAWLMMMAVLRGDLLFDQRQLALRRLQRGRDAPATEAQSMSACHDPYQLCSRRRTISANVVPNRHASAIPPVWRAPGYPAPDDANAEAEPAVHGAAPGRFRCTPAHCHRGASASSATQPGWAAASPPSWKVIPTVLAMTAAALNAHGPAVVGDRAQSHCDHDPSLRPSGSSRVVRRARGQRGSANTVANQPAFARSRSRASCPTCRKTCPSACRKRFREPGRGRGGSA